MDAIFKEARTSRLGRPPETAVFLKVDILAVQVDPIRYKSEPISATKLLNGRRRMP